MTPNKAKKVREAKEDNGASDAKKRALQGPWSPLGPFGAPWCPLEIGTHWSPFEPLGVSLAPPGTPWNPLGTLGAPEARQPNQAKKVSEAKGTNGGQGRKGP